MLIVAVTTSSSLRQSHIDLCEIASRGRNISYMLQHCPITIGALVVTLRTYVTAPYKCRFTVIIYACCK